MADCYRSDCERNVIGCIAQDVSLIGKYDLNKEDFSGILSTLYIILRDLYNQNYNEVTDEAIKVILESYPIVKKSFNDSNGY